MRADASSLWVLASKRAFVVKGLRPLSLRGYREGFVIAAVVQRIVVRAAGQICE